MTIMRPPQHGHGCASGSLVWAQLVSPASGRAAGTSSKRRILARASRHPHSSSVVRITGRRNNLRQAILRLGSGPGSPPAAALASLPK